MYLAKNPYFSLPSPLSTTFNWNAIESLLYQITLTVHLWGLSIALPFLLQCNRGITPQVVVAITCPNR